MYKSIKIYVRASWMKTFPSSKLPLKMQSFSESTARLVMTPCFFSMAVGLVNISSLLSRTGFSGHTKRRPSFPPETKNDPSSENSITLTKSEWTCRSLWWNDFHLQWKSTLLLVLNCSNDRLNFDVIFSTRRWAQHWQVCASSFLSIDWRQHNVSLNLLCHIIIHVNLP